MLKLILRDHKEGCSFLLLIFVRMRGMGLGPSINQVREYFLISVGDNINDHCEIGIYNLQILQS